MYSQCVNFEKGKGCKIYDTRPEECATFECLWLSGWIPGNLKPSKTGVVANLNPGRGLLLHEDEYADAKLSFNGLIDVWTRNGSDIGIIKYVKP
jgi:hypothetical protein